MAEKKTAEKVADKLTPSTVTQIAIVVRDINSKIHVWAEVLGLPVPEVITTATADQTNIEYKGRPTDARAIFSWRRPRAKAMPCARRGSRS